MDGRGVISGFDVELGENSRVDNPSIGGQFPTSLIRGEGGAFFLWGTKYPSSRAKSKLGVSGKGEGSASVEMGPSFGLGGAKSNGVLGTASVEVVEGSSEPSERNDGRGGVEK